MTSGEGARLAHEPNVLRRLAPAGRAAAASRSAARLEIAVLAASAALLLAAYLVFFYVFPQTPVRLEKASAALAHDNAWWRAVRALPLPRLHGTGLAAALLGAVCLAFVGYLAALLSARRRSDRGALGLAVGVAAVFVVASALALPNLDTDIYTYIGTGRVAAVHHRDPYAHATDRYPNDPYLRYASPQYTHYPDVKLAAWMPIDVGLAWAAGNRPATGLLVFRGFFAAADLGCLALVLLIVRRLRPERLTEAAVAWGWNPLTVLFAQSKVDVVMVLLLLLGALLLVRGARTRAVASLTLSALVKLLTAPYLVLLWLQEVRRRGRPFLAAAVVVGIVAVLYAPYAHPLRLLAHHLSLAGQGGSGGAQSQSPLRALPALGVIALVVFTGLRRSRRPEEMLRLWAYVALVVGAVTLATEYPWYLLTCVALVSVVGELRLTAAVAGLAAVSLAVYERRSQSTPTARLPGGSLFSPTTAVALGAAVVGAVVVLEYLRRRRRDGARIWTFGA